MKLSFPSPHFHMPDNSFPPLAFGTVVQQENEKSISYRTALSQESTHQSILSIIKIPLYFKTDNFVFGRGYVHYKHLLDFFFNLHRIKTIKIIHWELKSLEFWRPDKISKCSLLTVYYQILKIKTCDRKRKKEKVRWQVTHAQMHCSFVDTRKIKSYN